MKKKMFFCTLNKKFLLIDFIAKYCSLPFRLTSDTSPKDPLPKEPTASKSSRLTFCLEFDLSLDLALLLALFSGGLPSSFSLSFSPSFSIFCSSSFCSPSFKLGWVGGSKSREVWWRVLNGRVCLHYLGVGVGIMK